MLTEDQIAKRKGTIGASEIAAIMGASPFSSPVDVWLQKTGRTAGFSGNRATLAGQYLEAPILAMYADETQSVVVHPSVVWPSSTQGMLTHPDLPFVSATPDGVSFPMRFAGSDYSSSLAEEFGTLVDAKNVGFFSGSHYADGAMPDYYALQLVQQMAVTGIRRSCLAVLIGGQEFVTRSVIWSAEAEQMVLDAASSFWFDYVMTDTPPPVDGSEGWTRLIAQRLPSTLGPVVRATPEMEEQAKLLVAAREERKAIEKSEAEHSNRLKALLGDASGAKGEGWKCSWSKGSESVSWKELATELHKKAAGLFEGKSLDEVARPFTTVSARRFAVTSKGE